MKKNRVLIIGEPDGIDEILSVFSNDSTYFFHTSSIQLKVDIPEKIERSFFSVIIFMLTTPSQMIHFTKLQQLNPSTPKILVVPSSLHPLKVWQTSREDCFDIIHHPVHLVRLPFSVRFACKWHNQSLKIRETKDLILEKLDELSIIIEAGRNITSTLKLEEVAESIMDMITGLIRAEAWSLLLYDDEKSELVFKTTRGDGGKMIKEFRLKLGQGIAGWVALHKKPLIVNNVKNDDRFFKEIDIQTKFVTRSILCAPLLFKGKVLAVIEIINHLENRPFDKKDLTMISFLLDSAAIAIENAKLFNKAEELAITDELTLLYNARYLNQILEKELSRSERFDTEVSFIFMDLDHFKLVNDNYGHVAGRGVLKEVATLMMGNFRETDIIARYGGDEFVLVLPETGTKETFKLAENMRHIIENHTFLKHINHSIRLTASFGIATFPHHAKTKEELILMADKAMFQAKGNCRNMVYITSKEELSENNK